MTVRSILSKIKWGAIRRLEWWRLVFACRNEFYSMVEASAEIVVVFHFKLGGGASSYLSAQITRAPSSRMFIILKPLTISGAMEVEVRLGKRRSVFGSRDFGFLRRLPREKVTRLVVNEFVLWGAYYGKVAMGDRILAKLVHDVVGLKRDFGCPMLYLVHDYYSICPHYTLLDENYEYCGDSPTEEKCCRCLMNSYAENVAFPKSADVKKWRLSFAKLLGEAEEVRCFSEDARKRMATHFPTARLTVVPHEPLAGFVRKPILRRQPIVIGVFGEVSRTKGADRVLDLVRYLKKIGRTDVQIIIAGVVGTDVQIAGLDNIRCLGRYCREDLPRIVEENGINVAFFPSVWPETFSYVVQELIALRLPVVCYNIGAPAERVENYEYGIVVCDWKPESVWRAIQECVAKIV